MNIVRLYGDEETIRAFAAQVTRTRNPKKLLSKSRYSAITTKRSRIYNLMIEKIISTLDKLNHFSTREFNNMYLLITDSSRVFSFWLMKESVNGTFEQQSQRYVKIDAKNALPTLEDVIEDVAKAYDELIEIGIPKEDARYLLPQGVYTNFVMKTNLREIENLMKKFYSADYPEEVYEFIDKVMEIITHDYPFSSKRLVNELKELKEKRNRKKLFDVNLNSGSKYPSGKLSDVKIVNDEDLENMLELSEGWFDFSISISAAHQLIRHRKLKKIIYEIGDHYVIPESIQRNEEARKMYKKIVEKLFKKFGETGRIEYLPNATIVKIKAKEDLYMFIKNVVPLRTCYTAQWEIRSTVTKIRNQLQKKLGYEIPIGRCRFYTKDSKLKEIFPPSGCPEDYKECPIYKLLNSRG